MTATAVDARRWLVRYSGSGRGDVLDTDAMNRALTAGGVFDVTEIRPPAPCTCQSETEDTPPTEETPA